MPSLHIRPNRYQSNSREQIYCCKGSKGCFNLSGSTFKNEILDFSLTKIFVFVNVVGTPMGPGGGGSLLKKAGGF